MNTRNLSTFRPVAVATLIVGGLLIPLHFAEPAPPQTTAVTGTVYALTARTARRNHRVLGPPTVYVQGVPAEPVDSLVWDGIGSTPLAEASLALRVDPVNDRGRIRAAWTDDYGDWTYDQEIFLHPEHSSGARIGPSLSGTVQVINDPIVTNVYLHGDTGAGPPAVPTVFTLLATWGRARVTLNGVPFDNPFDGSASLGQWDGHTMLTVGVRSSFDGTVRTTTGGIYDFSQAGNGASDPDDLEFHLTFHDLRFPLTTNVPPLFEFLYHLTFENVQMSISHVEPGSEE